MTTLSDFIVRSASQASRRTTISPFYARWPRAMSAITLARELFTDGHDQ